MRKVFKLVLVILILIILFLVNYIPHYNQMPLHTDAWQLVVKADFVLGNKELTFVEPFSGLIIYYPPGGHLGLAIIKSITGLDMLFLAQLLPAVFFVILGLLLYALSKLLFKNELVAITIMAFTPLALSNITILGPFYLVPLAWGMLLSLLFFYLIIKENWILSFFVFIILAATHTSSMVFSIIAIGLYFVFNKKYWSKIKHLFLILLAAFIIFIFVARGFNVFYGIVTSLFAFQKAKPYISFYSTMPFIFLILLAFGFYFILSKEKKASKFLIPLFTLMAVNVFLYWYWQGFLLVYRRLFTFTFMMTSFFVGYAVFNISQATENVIGRSLKFVKKHNIILIILLIVLVPIAVRANIESHKDSEIYVDNVEHELFTEFGKQYPNVYLSTDHLQAFAMPYYNLKPIQLSPMHIGNTKYFPLLSPCYSAMNVDCFVDFFSKHNFTYLYTKFKISSDVFKPFFTHNNKTIYKFDREAYDVS